MSTLADFRRQYPQYDDMSDVELAEALHKKYYSDLPKEQVFNRLGITPPQGTPAPASTADAMALLQQRGTLPAPTAAPEEEGIFSTLGRAAARGVPRIRQGLAQILEDAPEIVTSAVSMFPSAGGPVVGRALQDLGRVAAESETYKGLTAEAVASERAAAERQLAELGPRRFGGFFEEEGFGRSLGSLAETVAESALPVVAGAATGLVTRSPVAAGAIMAGGNLPMTYGGIRERQQAEGIDDVGRAVAGTAVSSALDILTGVGGKVLSGTSAIAAREILEAGFQQAVTRVAKSGLEESGTEMLQNVVEQVAGGTNPATKQAMLETLEAGLAGALGGTVFTGATEVVAAPFRPRAGTQEATALAADPAIRAEFQRLAAVEVAAIMAADPEISQNDAVAQVSERAEELLSRAAANIVGAEEEADVATDTDTAVDVVGGGGAGAPIDLGPAPTETGAAVAGETVGGGLGRTVPSVPVPDVGEGAGVAPLAPVTAKQVKAVVPTIEEAFNANAIDFEDAYGVKKLNAEQKKQAARIVIQSPEVDPYDAIGSVLERGARLRGEKITPAPVAPAPTPVPAPAVPAAPSVDEVAVAPVKAAVEAAVAPTPPTSGVVPSLAQTTAREVGITPPPITPPAPSTITPTPAPTPQQIANNLQAFAVPEAQDRGLDVPMFREGVRDVQRGVEPIPDQQILDAQGPEVLASYKAGQQWAQDRIAEAQAAPTAVDEELAARDQEVSQELLAPEVRTEPTVADTATVAPEQVFEDIGEPSGTVTSLGERRAAKVMPKIEAVLSGQVRMHPDDIGDLADDLDDLRKAGAVDDATFDELETKLYDAERAARDRITPPNDNRPETPLEKAQREYDNASQRLNDFFYNPDDERGYADRRTKVRKEYERELSALEVEVEAKRAAFDAAWEAERGGPLKDISENPTPTELVDTPSSNDVYGLAEELPEAERVNVRARLDRIMANYAKDGSVDRLLGSMEALREDVERRIDRDRAKRGRDRVRGFERAMEVIYRAERTGQLTPEAANLARWLLEQNPAIADELALSLRTGGPDSPAGQYEPASRIATIFANRANDGTAAHEILHHAERLMPEKVRNGIRAAWMKRIQDLTQLAERTGNTNMREVLGAIVRAYYGDAQAQRELRESFESGAIPYSVYHLSNPSEFWAVNATDLVGKRANRTRWVGAARNWIRGLIEKVKDFFGLPNDSAVITGLNSVLEAESGTLRGQMLSAATTQFMDQTASEGGTQPPTDANVDAAVSAKLTKAQIKRLEQAAGIQRMKLSGMQKRIARSRSAEETMSLAGRMMLLARKPDESVGILTSLFNSVPPPILQALLAPLETADVVRLGENAGMKNVTLIDNMMRDEYIPYVNRIMERASKLAEKWADFVSRSPEGADAMGDVMYFSNMIDADPSLAPSVAEYLKIDQEFQATSAKLAAETDLKKKSALKGQLTRRRGEIQRLYFGATDPDGTKIAGWKDVPPEGKQLFREARDYYRADFQEHYRLLMQRIDDAQFEEEDAARLKAAVDDMFKEAAKRVIYFPMKRFGDYWVSVGKGKSGEFHMFESASAQDAFIARLRREGETREIDFSKGADTLRLGLRKQTADASSALKGILDLIDGGDIKDVDLLKDHVFQMYLTALPEADMRRRFIHRQFKTGFSTDALRTFANTAIASANQLGRLAYNYKFKNLLDQSYAEVAGNPSKRRLDTITRELEMRITTTLSPEAKGGWDQLANLGAKATFLFILSSPKSAFMNLTQLHIVGLPTLSAEFGEKATYAMAARYTGQMLTGKRLANPFRDAEGNLRLQLPEFTAEGSAYINGLRETDPDRYQAILKAWEYAQEREVTESTFSSAANVYERSNEPTTEMNFTQAARQGNAALAVQRATANAVNGLGALFHHTERIGREIMYMSAFELAYDRALAEGKTSAEATEIALPKAVDMTNKGMFDFSSWNKSRAAKTPVGKLALQMRSYSIAMTSLLFRSFTNMVAFNRTKAERLAAARVFMGVGAITTLYGGLRASQFYFMGMLAYGLYEFAKSAFEDDDEEEEIEQGYLNPETIDRELLKFADEKGRELTKKDMDYYIRTVWIPETLGKGGTMQEALGLSDGVADKLAAASDIGIPGIFGVDISNSVALTNLWHPIDAKSDDPVVKFYETAGRGLLGPSGSLLTAPFVFYEEANKGNFDKAIESITPAALRGYVKAERLKDEGLRVGKNQDIVLRDPSFYDTYTLAMQSLGFAEAETSRAMQLDIKAGEIEQEVAAEKTDLLDRRYRAINALGADPTEETQRALREIERDIEIYNLNYPSNAISNETKERSFQQKRREADERMYGIGIDANIPIRQPLVEERAPEVFEGQ